jgi:hypothetical protein
MTPTEPLGHPGATSAGRCLTAMILFSGVAYTAAAAAEQASTSLPWKLTVGEYAYSTYWGTDANLRWRQDDTSAWVGVYTDPSFGTQARAGADTTIDLGKYLQIQPSLQLASRGFVGGSVNLQAGGAWYGLVGLGRTNTKPYFNLNFDPNDALTVGGGHQTENGAAISVFVVADDRLHTGQRDWHLNVRIPAGSSHATLDLLRKSGWSDAGPITGWGFSGNWDRPTWFMRVAYDPYQNFSAQNVWRVAAGKRF